MFAAEDIEKELRNIKQQKISAILYEFFWISTCSKLADQHIWKTSEI